MYGAYPAKAHFASYNGIAPIDVSSGHRVRHRLNRSGNRRLNYALHIAALSKSACPGPGRDYYLGKRDAGETRLEAMRCLNRRLSDVAFRALLADPEEAGEAGPAGQAGATLQSSASDPTPTASPSDKSLT